MRKLILTSLAGAVIVLSLSFSSPVKQGGAAASIARGKAVYTQYCLACHQADGSGVPRLNPPLIKTKYVLGDKTALVTIVLKGLTGEIEVNDDTYNNVMPPHNFLTDQQIADVLTFVRNSFGNKAPAITTAQVKAVRAKTKTATPKNTTTSPTS